MSPAAPITSGSGIRVTTKLLAADGLYTTLRPGDSIDLVDAVVRMTFRHAPSFLGDAWARDDGKPQDSQAPGICQVVDYVGGNITSEMPLGSAVMNL